MVRKALASVWAILLLLGCLAGCSQNGAGAAPGSETENTCDADTPDDRDETEARQPIAYTYNCHLLLPQYEGALTEDELTVCHRLADAVEAGDTIVQAEELDNSESFNKVWYAYIASQPIYGLTDAMHYSDGQITIVYKNDHDRHVQLVESWRTLITGIITSNVFEDDSETDRAYRLYRYIATHVAYNYDEAADVNVMLRRGAYETLTEGSGVCKDYSRAYNFLLTQCGILCYEVDDEGIDHVSHTWSMVRLSGQWYHMDATFDSCDGAYLDSNGTYAYTVYFGMSDDRRYESRPSEWYVRCGQNYEDRIDTPVCPASLDYSCPD